jgi:hypothetical protein
MKEIHRSKQSTFEEKFNENSGNLRQSPQRKGIGHGQAGADRIGCQRV